MWVICIYLSLINIYSRKAVIVCSIIYNNIKKFFSKVLIQDNKFELVYVNYFNSYIAERLYIMYKKK